MDEASARKRIKEILEAADKNIKDIDTLLSELADEMVQE